MNSYSNIFGMYYSIWLVPNVNGNGAQYFAPYTIYPQFSQPQPVNLRHQVPSIQDENNRIEQNKNPSDERQHQNLNENAPQNVQPEKNEKSTVQTQSNVSKHQNIKKQSKKPKRPQTYLTEKAYYMKHKLKGKHKTGARILRKRPKTIQIQTKNNDSQKLVKKSTEAVKIKKKKLSILRGTQKQKKIVNKIRLKLLNEPLDDFAKLPPLISGSIQINEFCRAKLQNLMQRQMTSNSF